MQVSARDDCGRTSFHYCKRPDQWRVSPSQCWKLRRPEFDRHLRPCVGKSFSCWCCSVKASKNPIVTRNHVACSSSQQEWAGDWTNLAMLEEQTFALVQCLASLFIDAAFMQQSSSYPWPVLLKGHTCRTILSRVAIFAKGQINEECVLRNVESWQSLSLADTSDLVFGRALVADAAVWRLSGIPALPGIALPVPVPSKNVPRIEQILQCWKNKHLP